MNVRETLEERLGIFDGFYDKMQVFGPIDKADSFEKQGRCFAGANCINVYHAKRQGRNQIVASF